MRRRTALTLLAAAASAPLVRATEPGRIEIDGNRLLWNGATLRLGGIAMGDPVYIRHVRTLDDYRVVATDWAANCVRISVHPGHWRSDPPRLFALLDAEIAAARSHDLFVILDWHAIGFPGLYEPIPPPQWGLAADVYLASIEDAVAFWQVAAARYGADPAMLFEIWNEPVGDPMHWDSDGAHWPTFRAAWTTIIDAIRAQSDTVVLAAGGRWAHDLTGAAADPLDDIRTGYVWHVYPNEDRERADRWTRSLGDLAERKPIVVTEWGFCLDCDSDYAASLDDFARPFTALLDAFGMSHTAWCYSAGAAPPLLAADGHSPSAAGQFVRDYLRRQR